MATTYISIANLQKYDLLLKDYIAEGLVLKAPCGLLTRTGERLITKIKYKDFQEFGRKHPDINLDELIEQI